MSDTAESVMCTLCGLAGSVETDIEKPDGVASAVAWAAHFAWTHPDASRPVDRHLVMTGPDEADAS